MFKTFLFILFVFSTTVFAQNKSVYTDLSEEKCKPIKGSDQIPGNYAGRCEGVAGYELEVYLDDERNSIGVVTPSKKIININLWDYFANFSGLREKAEWRMKAGKPVGLIVRLNVSDEGDEKAPTSYLIVSKIGPTKACVTDVVKPIKDQNIIAQRLADQALSKPCKKRSYK